MSFDIAIVGAGIAGATLGAALASHARVLLLEAEDVPGYHATGRSAAFWSETYGGPMVQPLTTASAAMLHAGGYLAPLGSLHIGRADDRARADALLAEFANTAVALEAVDPRDIVPGLHKAWYVGVLEPSCAYIDVARLHGDALTSVRRAGGSIVTGAQVTAATRRNGRWTIETSAGGFTAAILVDAAGAWADPVALAAGVAPLGIQPYRRTMAQLRVDPLPPRDLPHVIDLAGTFYFKPEGERLWLSPHDETAAEAGDAAAEELDVAMAIDRMEQAVDWRVQAVERRWAGLRSFAPDRLPVIGFDTCARGFFWFAGQGGFGIQTAPAAAALGAALLLGTASDPALDPTLYAAGRF